MNLFEVNVAGTIRVLQAFLPLIKGSTQKQVGRIPPHSLPAYSQPCSRLALAPFGSHSDPCPVCLL